MILVINDTMIWYNDIDHKSYLYLYHIPIYILNFTHIEHKLKIFYHRYVCVIFWTPNLLLCTSFNSGTSAENQYQTWEVCSSRINEKTKLDIKTTQISNFLKWREQWKRIILFLSEAAVKLSRKSVWCFMLAS